MNKFFVICALLCAFETYAFPSRLSFTTKDQAKIQTLKQNSDEVSIIAFMEQKYGIPQGLLAAISHVESRIDSRVVNVKGKSYRFKTRNAALKFINEQIKCGVTWIDIGCMQIHYRAHRKHFMNAAQLLDPFNNIEYAAAFLTNLRQRFGSWQSAVKFYHSSTPHHQSRYMRCVNKAWKKNSNIQFHDVVYKPNYIKLKNRKNATLALNKQST